MLGLTAIAITLALIVGAIFGAIGVFWLVMHGVRYAIGRALNL